MTMSVFQSLLPPVYRAKLRMDSLVAMLRPSPLDRLSEEGRARERHRRMALTSMASATGKVISIATSLISIPLTLHYLGAERYGVWLTISSLTAMLSFADLGLGNGVLNRIAGAHGRDDRAAIRQYVSSAYAVLTPLAVLVLTGFLVAGIFGPWKYVFNIHGPAAQREVGPAMAAFAACFAVAIPAGVIQRVQMGLQEGFQSSLWQCGSSLLALAALLVAISLHAGLPWLVVALLGAPSVGGLLNSLLFFGRLQPDISPRFNAISRGALTDIGHTGLLFFVLQTVGAVAYASDNVIVARALGADKVPLYAVPNQLFTVIPMLLAMVLAPLWPAYGEAISRQDNAWVKKTLKRSLLASVGFAGVASLLLVVGAPLILRLWVGRAVDPPILLLVGLGAWKVVEAGGNALAMFLNGANVVRFQVMVATVTGACALGLKVILIQMIGVAGPPWGALIAYSLCCILPLYIFIRRRFAF